MSKSFPHLIPDFRTPRTIAEQALERRERVLRTLQNAGAGGPTAEAWEAVGGDLIQLIAGDVLDLANQVLREKP